MTVSMTKIAGAGMILTAIIFTVGFSLLGAMFDYPDILRAPTPEIFEKFQDGGDSLVAVWYLMVATSILAIPTTILVNRSLMPEPTSLRDLGHAFGVIAGITNFLGFIRWPFLVPILVDTYYDATSSEATRASVSVTFEAFHRYAGVAIGEHLGFIFTALWIATVSAVMLRSPLIRRWVGWMGFVAAILFFSGVFEPAGIEIAADTSAIGSLIWGVWMIVVGVFLLRAKTEAGATVSG